MGKLYFSHMKPSSSFAIFYSYSLRRCVRYFVLVILCAITTTSFGQESKQKQIAQTQMGFLAIPDGARYTGMGSAAVGLSEGVESVFINPAGLGVLETGSEFSVSQTLYIADINKTALGIAKGFRNIGTFAVTAAFMDYGELMRTVRTDDPSEPYLALGAFSPTSLAIGLAYARRHTDRFYFGGHLKLAYEHLGTSRLGVDQEGKDLSKGYRDVENTLTLLVFDFGTRYYPGFGDLNLSASWQHFSQEQSYVQQGFPLPLTFTFGCSMDILSIFKEEKYRSHKFTVACDYLQVRDFGNKVHIGGEYWFQKRIALRSGYKFRYDEEGWTAGVGFRLDDVIGMEFGLDYSYGYFGVFDDVQRFSIIISK